MAKRNSGRKDQILDTAANLFASRSYHGTSIDDIASEVGLVKSSLYEHFGGKEDLLLKMLERAIEEMDTSRGITESGLTGQEKLSLFIKDHVEFVSEHHNASAVIFRHLAIALPRSAREMIDQGRRAYWDRLLTILSEGVERGDFRSDLDVKIVGRSLLGMCAWTSMWYRPNGRCTASEIAATYWAMALEGLRADGPPLSPVATIPRSKAKVQDDGKKVSKSYLARRKRVIDAATELFAKKGYHGTSMNDIASEVGCVKRTVYQFCTGKEDLLFQVIGTGMEDMVSSLASAVKLEDDSRTKISLLVQNNVKFVNDHLSQSTVVFQHMAILLPDTVRERVNNGLRAYWQLLRTIIEEGVERGDFRSDLDVGLMARSLMGMFYWIPTWYRPNGRYSFSDVGETFTQVALTGIAADRSSLRSAQE